MSKLSQCVYRKEKTVRQNPLRSQVYALLIFSLFVVLALSGCGARSPEAPPENRVNHRPASSSENTNAELPISAEVVPRNYSAPLPATEVTDLTVPGGIVSRYGYENTSGSDGSYDTKPHGFADAAGSDVLNLRRELMTTGRPSDASTRVSDPTIPSAIPTDEVAVNTDFAKPETFSSASYGRQAASSSSSSSSVYPPSQLPVDGAHKTTTTRTHIVQKGETLYGISRKYGVTVRSIVDANDKLNNPDQLYVGANLIIPSP